MVLPPPQVRSNSVVYLDVDTTVQSISLPANGKLVLAPTVSIQLTADSECTGKSLLCYLYIF
jgi:hypothetical protein